MKFSSALSVLVLLSISPSAANAASPDKFIPIPNSQQKIVYADGVGYLVGDGVAVGVRSYDSLTRRISVNIQILNKLSDSQNFGPGNISVTDGDGVALPVKTIEDLQRSLNSSANIKKFGVGILSAVGTAISIAASVSTTTGTIRNSDGTVSYYDSTHTDPAIAVAGSAASIGGGLYLANKINANRDQKLAIYSDQYLQNTTLAPNLDYGRSYSPYFMATAPFGFNAPRVFFISVAANGHTEKFEIFVSGREMPTFTLQPSGVCAALTGNDLIKCMSALPEPLAPKTAEVASAIDTQNSFQLSAGTAPPIVYSQDIVPAVAAENPPPTPEPWTTYCANLLNDPRLEPLFRSTNPHGEPTLSQQNITEHVSEDQKPAIEILKQNGDLCFIKVAEQDSATWTIFETFDAERVDWFQRLYSGKVTWGEYNTHLQNVAVRMKTAFASQTR